MACFCSVFIERVCPNNLSWFFVIVRVASECDDFGLLL